MKATIFIYLVILLLARAQNETDSIDSEDFPGHDLQVLFANPGSGPLAVFFYNHEEMIEEKVGVLNPGEEQLQAVYVNHIFVIRSADFNFRVLLTVEPVPEDDGEHEFLITMKNIMVDGDPDGFQLQFDGNIVGSVVPGDVRSEATKAGDVFTIMQAGEPVVSFAGALFDHEEL